MRGERLAGSWGEKLRKVRSQAGEGTISLNNKKKRGYRSSPRQKLRKIKNRRGGEIRKGNGGRVAKSSIDNANKDPPR